MARLAATDRHLRAHEQAHLAAAGQYSTGGPSYTYTVGPDGQRYAVAGEVGLDVSPEPSDPEKTIEKARAIEAAANAPADPSSQDRMVAAIASQMEAAARRQLEAQLQQVQAAFGRQAAAEPGALFSLLV